VVAGGTAGHIIPALSIAEELRRRDKKAKILFVTSRSKKDEILISNKGFKIKKIFAGKLRRYFSFSNFTDIFFIIAGFFQSLFLVVRYKPDIIFSKGSYVSLPVVVAGRILGKRILIHESDFSIGLANKFSLRFADKLAVSFPLKYYNKKLQNKLVFSGNPIRNLHSGKKIKESVDTLVILGGSQGARNINVKIFAILKDLINKDIKIIHFVGDSDFPSAKRLRTGLLLNDQKNYVPFSNIFDEKEYGKILNEAKLIISRAGSTIFEIAFLSKPAILIPLSGHQQQNARILDNNDAAIVIEDNNLTSEILKEMILSLISNQTKLNKLAKNISKFSTRNAAGIIVDQLFDMVSR